MLVPPATVKSIAPVLPPLQTILVCVLVNESAVGAVIVFDIVEDSQPFASLIFNWYVPAAKFENIFEDCQVEPLSIEYSLVPDPPVAVTVIAPFVEVGQEICAPLYDEVTAAVPAKAAGAVIVTEVIVEVQLLVSFTLIV